jgi:hypothetical protein
MRRSAHGDLPEDLVRGVPAMRLHEPAPTRVGERGGTPHDRLDGEQEGDEHETAPREALARLDVNQRLPADVRERDEDDGRQQAAELSRSVACASVRQTVP